MSDITQRIIVQHQVASFEELGWKTRFEIQDHAPKIKITKGFKVYRFSDPDWLVVSKQLAKLYRFFVDSRVNK